MTIYTLVTVDRNREGVFIQNVIASYTDEKVAIQELEWRRRTETPQFLNRNYRSPLDYQHNRTYEIIRSKLITDKFTEFALGATNEQIDTN